MACGYFCCVCISAFRLS
ncbi:hypothetical protein EGC82_08840 [Shewanella livingstonensis]|uniref:Uncharacterized protein n=1 Tax=Shewanella livingstonensis TaxID=150120 RepID=A0A3G8LZS9_9GAMM|nr:hypothetical protein EGC82_08840 [Shewanella livingstonensis]